MKKCFFSLASVLLIFFAAAQTPVAWYPFNGNANDAAGTNHGTVNGATLTTDRFGNASSAYSFDGVNDNIIFSAPWTTATDNFSIVAWIKRTNGFTVLCNGQNAFNVGGPDNGYAIKCLTVVNFDLCGIGGPTSPANSFTTGVWQHVAVVRENGICQIYINGVLQPVTSANAPNVPAVRAIIGSLNLANDFFEGSVDEVKIFNSALTAVQVQREYNPDNYSGQFNNSVNMNGVNDYIQPPAVLNGATQFTIEYWIKSAENRSNGTFSQNPTMIGNEVPGASSGEFSIYSSNGFIGMWGELNSGTQNFVSSSTKINDNRWHHIAAVNNGTNVVLYVDGISVGSIPSGNGIATSGNPLRIGANNPASIGLVPHQGYFDEVRFWNIARTQSELITSMNAPLAGTETGLEAYWDMNRSGQGAGLTVDNKCVATGAALNGTTVGTASTPVFELGVTQLKPGSGNAIIFDGVDDFVDIPSTANLNFGTSQDFVVETWVKISVSQNFTATTDNIILDKWGGFGSGSAYPFSIRIQNNGSPDANKITVVRTNDIGGGAAINSLNTMNDNKWHHIAFAKNGTVLSLYVDGVLNGTIPDLLTGNTGNSATVTAGKRNGASQQAFFTGSIDEVRIWNTALTQTQIRDRMCRKITSSDALYPNLVAYYNFDESAGTTAFDGTINGNNGTLTNSPTRATSGAAIGNASSHDYVNATKTASLAHASGESFTVTSTSGNPDGIQVYRADEQPNTLAGATGVGTNDKYFGVFQVNGTAPQYTAVYNYTGNAGVTPLNEPDLRLNKRTDNAVTSWTMLPNTPNESANTITVSGESTEYILGKLGAPLPLRLVTFYGSRQNNDALLQWKTVDEINSIRFEVQRSDEGVHFKTFTTVPAGNNNYSVSDPDVFGTRATVFYRLKSVDKDGKFAYSNSIKLSSQPLEILTIFPNPVQGLVSISGLKQNGVLQLYNAEGRLLQQQTVRAQSVTIDMSAYAKGLYLLQYLHNGTTVSEKMLKQ